MLVMVKATLRAIHSEEEYEAELAKCAGVTGYHRWFFMKAVSESADFHMRTFAVEKDGSAIGVLPILLRRRGPVSTVNYSPVSRLDPLLSDPTFMSDVLAAADRYLRRNLTVVTKSTFSPDSPITPSSLTDIGFKVKQMENFIIPAGRSTTEQLAAMSRRNRRSLTACQSLGMKASSAEGHEIEDWFADRVSAPFKKQGIVPEYTRAGAANLVRLLGADPRMLWRSVHNSDGQLIAVTASIIDVDRLYCWMIVGDHDSQPSPHIFAYWDMIQWALDRGLTCDFAGAPNDGIRTFKIRLGAETEPYLYAERVKPEMYQTLRTLHSRISLKIAKDLRQSPASSLTPGACRGQL
jgi:CelD/BcsL family acetyltransferase involved in cellulose biosynthesis